MNINTGEKHWGVPFWVLCHCDEWFCKKHNLHAHECECPHIEELMEMI